MARHTREFTPKERWAEIDLLRTEYKSFTVFLYDVITDLMGFDTSDIQMDIASFLEYGPKERMIQAQRGQAKTTITAAYAVWRLIHDPSTRILIISAGGTQATEIANWVIQIINNMEVLECLRPDRSSGDRESVEAYDIHYELKGPEKSPSIACVGITSNMQGKRADVLIADDIESSKNSQTAGQRERLHHLTKDFTSICSNGDIIYLGTPQSVDSVYNSLNSRGYAIRIWPGRYPTADEEANYGAFLAPLIRTRMVENPSLRTGGGPTGTRGQPVDPVLLGEETLTKKEIDQGKSYFQLQHMLDTRLSDADRFPLKLADLVFMQVSNNTVPLEIYVQKSTSTLINSAGKTSLEGPFYRAAAFGQEHGAFMGTYMYVDPAGGGQNGDETAYAVTKFSAGRVFLVDFGAVPGGVGEDALDALTKIAVKWKPESIGIERNFGNGALAAVWKPKLFREHRCGIEEEWESGQKELRIIDVLEPVIGSNRLVVDENLLYSDWDSTSQYPVESRLSYSFFFQLSRITRDKKSLKHDDRLDAVAGAVRKWSLALVQDSLKIVNQQRTKAWRERMKNPLGDGTKMPHTLLAKLGLSTSTSAVSKYRRKF